MPLSGDSWENWMVYLVIAITIVALALWAGLNYRNLLALRRSVEACANKLSEQLKQRHDSIEKFVGSLPDELKQESDLTQKLREARARAVAQAQEPLKQRESVENELGDCIGRLLSALQKDGHLADSERYSQLRDRVLDVEDVVTLARQDYNDLVVRFNLQQTILPASLFAKKAGIKPLEEFEIDDVFAKYPLKIKGTMPTPKRSVIFGVEPEPEAKERESN